MRKSILVAAAMAVALVLAGCGGDDSDDAEPEEPPSATVDAGDGPGTTAPDDGEPDDGDDGDGSDELACEVDESIAGFGNAIAGLFMGMANPSAMDDAISEVYGSTEGLADRMREAAEEAPEAIRDDVRTAVEKMAPVFEAMPTEEEVRDAVQEALDSGDSSEMEEVFSGLTEGFGELESDPEFQEATDNIEAWVAANC